jgi:hypothetical protein
MSLIEIKVDEFANFINYYGLIMFKEYKRWLSRTKLEPNFKVFIRFKFHKEMDRRHLRKKEKKYEFKQQTEFKSTATKIINSKYLDVKESKRKALKCKDNSNIDIKIDPDLRESAKKDGATIKTKYITYDDIKCDELAEITIINKTLVTDIVYDEVTPFEISCLEYDFLNPIDMECQTDNSFFMKNVLIQTDESMMCVGDNKLVDQPIPPNNNKMLEVKTKTKKTPLKSNERKKKKNKIRNEKKKKLKLELENSKQSKLNEMKVDQPLDRISSTVNVDIGRTLVDTLSNLLIEPDEPDLLATEEEVIKYREDMVLHKIIMKENMGDKYSSAAEDEYDDDGYDSDEYN